MKRMKPLSQDEIIRQGEKYAIPSMDSYELDTNYVAYLFSLDSVAYKKEVNNHLQPLQAFYYDQNGQLISFHINCNAGGFPNLKWNRFGNFDQFIPKQQTPLDSILPLEKQLGFLKPIKNNSPFDLGDYDYIIVVHWGRFMGRQSKRLIRIVQKNVALGKDFKTKIIYVNNDNEYANFELN